VRFLQTLADKLFGRFTPVAPFVQAFADGLRNDPANYSCVIDRQAGVLEFAQREGELARNGLTVTFQRSEKAKFSVVVANFIFDLVAINRREANLLKGAAADWLLHLEENGAAIRAVGKRSVGFTCIGRAA